MVVGPRVTRAAARASQRADVIADFAAASFGEDEDATRSSHSNSPRPEKHKMTNRRLLLLMPASRKETMPRMIIPLLLILSSIQPLVLSHGWMVKREYLHVCLQKCAWAWPVEA